MSVMALFAHLSKEKAKVAMLPTDVPRSQDRDLDEMVLTIGVKKHL